MSPQRGDRLTIEIESLAVGGRGVARHSSQNGRLVIFVNDVTPQDVVEVELTKVKKNFAEARLVKVLHPSPFRRLPECSVAGVCGGCSWQHVEYAEQLRQKRVIVEQALRRMSGFNLDEGFVEPVVPSPREFRYRNRIQLQHQPGTKDHKQSPATASKKAEMGFFKRGSHQIVDIEDCLITEEIITREIPRLKTSLVDTPPGRVELLVDQSGHFAVRKGEPDNSADYRTDDSTDDCTDDHTNDSHASAFSQVNTLQNQALVEFVVNTIKNLMTNTASVSTIYDLYAGNGNFTFPLAQTVNKSRILAVELNQESVLQARQKNAQVGANIEFQQADVGEFLRKLPAKALAKSIVLLDPPRTGCEPDVILALADGSPAFLVYVSCHPVTLARDLKPLKNAGFELLRVLPFDMFPQTDHVESVAVLKRSH